MITMFCQGQAGSGHSVQRRLIQQRTHCTFLALFFKLKWFDLCVNIKEPLISTH